MRQRRTIYYNDARHYYLFVHEPPMRLEDAWMPVDEVAGTAVDTFGYGVSRSDGCFYPSTVGNRWGQTVEEFQASHHWRVWQNMESLIGRGLDPLALLIDRAHDKGMDFLASHRMSDYVGLPAESWQLTGAVTGGKYAIGGSGSEANNLDFTHLQVREHKLSIFEELVNRYATDGIELDFAFSPYYFKPQETEKGKSIMTDLVGQISRVARNRTGKPAVVGARVFPTEAMCLNAGLDVREWLEEGYLDFVVPMLYGYNLLDPNMPFDWLVEAAHESDVSVYGMLQPFVAHESTGAPEKARPAPEVMRATAANYWDRGVDGLYTWYMQWPLGDAQRRMLTELGDPDLVKEGSKLYDLPRRSEAAAKLGYDATLPLRIPGADPGASHAIPFYISDDLERTGTPVRQVRLKTLISNLVAADQITIRLNGQSLAGETCIRSYPGEHNQYSAQWLEFTLEGVRPCKGQNVLEIALDCRPPKLGGGITVEQVQVCVEYGTYPSGLNHQPSP